MLRDTYSSLPVLETLFFHSFASIQLPSLVGLWYITLVTVSASNSESLLLLLDEDFVNENLFLDYHGPKGHPPRPFQVHTLSTINGIVELVRGKNCFFVFSENITILLSAPFAEVKVSGFHKYIRISYFAENVCNDIHNLICLPIFGSSKSKNRPKLPILE